MNYWDTYHRLPQPLKTWAVHNVDNSYVGTVKGHTETEARNQAIYYFGAQLSGDFSVRER